MVDSPGLSKCHELTRVFGILANNREITVMHFVDNQIGRRLGNRTLVAAPMSRIGLLHINDGATLTVGTYGFCENSRALTFAHVKGIELTHQIAFDGSGPALVASLLHLHALDSFASQTIFVDADSNLFSVVRCKQLELGLLRCIAHLFKRLCYYLMG